MSAVDRAALIEAAEAVMIREGGRLAEWHGWRCAYPEQYGQCDCNRVVAADIISELLPLIADAIAMSRIEMYDEATPGTVTYDFAVNVKSKAAHLVRSLLSTDNDQ